MPAEVFVIIGWIAIGLIAVLALVGLIAAISLVIARGPAVLDGGPIVNFFLLWPFLSTWYTAWMLYWCIYKLEPWLVNSYLVFNKFCWPTWLIDFEPGKAPYECRFWHDEVAELERADAADGTSETYTAASPAAAVANNDDGEDGEDNEAELLERFGPRNSAARLPQRTHPLVRVASRAVRDPEGSLRNDSNDDES